MSTFDIIEAKLYFRSIVSTKFDSISKKFNVIPEVLNFTI